MPRSTLGAAAVLLTTALAGCSTGSAVPAAAETLVHASAEQQAAFVQAVAAIAPPLADQPERVIRNGRDVCLDIVDSLDDRSLAYRAAERFSGGTDTVTEDQARRIVAAARTTLCAG
jgi:hypothetical protein